MTTATADKNLFLGSRIDVRRGSNPDGTPRIVSIESGQWARNTDLTAKEIEHMKALGVIRRPTAEELEAITNREEEKEAAQTEAADSASIASDAERLAAAKSKAK